MTMINAKYDELNEKVKHEESIEYPGYYTSYHRKPEDVSTREWIEVVNGFYNRKGYELFKTLASVEFERNPYDPYPLENKAIGWGIEAVWRY